MLCPVEPGDSHLVHLFASAELRISGSHDPCEIACNLIMLCADMLFVGIRSHEMREMR